MTEPSELTEPAESTPLYAWCFSHGRLHRFHADPARAWCTATWMPLEGESEDAALADKNTRYGQALFDHELARDQRLAVINACAARYARQTPSPSGHAIRPGQIYASCDPRGGFDIRVIEEPRGNRVDVVDAVTGGRRRSILTKALHPDGTTRTGQPRRTGYRLVSGGPETVPTPGAPLTGDT
ncbi:hypothetical protein ACGFJT_41895 [Actinomadura geliboluensis]|uniref:hypothetical protein n=1 Tax=Actinomadura geliboluensis TaxID=882440 RepID=UPI00371EAF42